MRPAVRPASPVPGDVGIPAAALSGVHRIWAAVDLKRRPGKHGMGRAVFAIVAGALVTAITAAVAMA